MERASPSRHELQALKGCLCLALRRTTRLVTQQYDAALRPFGVRVTQLPILTAAAGGATPLAQLAAVLGMERTTLLRNVRPLVRRGLIVVRREKGGRRDEVTATTAGRALLQRLYPAWREVQDRMLADLKDPALLRTLAEMGQPMRRQ